MVQIWGMVATPFTSDGLEVDLGALDRLTRYLVAEGCTMLGLFGAIAEAETLTPGERRGILATVRQAAPRTPLAIAVPPGSLPSRTGRDFEADDLPDGSVVVLPSAHTDAAGLIDDAERWRAETGLDVALEDRPGPGCHILPIADLVSAVRNGDIAFVKEEAPPSVDRIRALRTSTTSIVLAGNGGAAALDELLAGAHGLIAGISQTGEIVAMARAWERGDPTGAALIHARIAALIAFETHSPRSVGIRKEAWRRGGILRSNAVRRATAGWVPSLEPHLAMHERLRRTALGPER